MSVWACVLVVRYHDPELLDCTSEFNFLYYLTVVVLLIDIIMALDVTVGACREIKVRSRSLWQNFSHLFYSGIKASGLRCMFCRKCELSLKKARVCLVPKITRFESEEIGTQLRWSSRICIFWLSD